MTDAQAETLKVIKEAMVAARNAALEEAAELMVSLFNPGEDMGSELAARIRELKDKP